MKLNWNKQLVQTSKHCYDSYWLGKFSNLLMKSGHKLKADNLVEQLSLLTKVNNKFSFLHLFLKKLTILRPIFKMKFSMVRGKRKEYPVILNPRDRYKVALRWLKSSLLNSKTKVSKMSVLSILESFNNENLVKMSKSKRDSLLKEVVKNRFNIRFSYKK